MRISSRITALKYKCLYNSLLYINRNNAETKRYQEEGLKLLSGKVDSLPSNRISAKVYKTIQLYKSF